MRWRPLQSRHAQSPSAMARVGLERPGADLEGLTTGVPPSLAEGIFQPAGGITGRPGSNRNIHAHRSEAHLGHPSALRRAPAYECGYVASIRCESSPKLGGVLLLCARARASLSPPLPWQTVRAGRTLRPWQSKPWHHMTQRTTKIERRLSRDRRQEEQGPPASQERRRAVEARQPETTELHLSEEEFRALGFTPPAPGVQKPG